MSEQPTQDRYLWLQRLLEMVPGTVSWAVIIGPIWLSFSYPWLVAYFVLSFDFYWLCRALWFSGAVIVAYRRIRQVLATDWRQQLVSLEDPMMPSWEEYTHLALIPTYTEPLETLRHTVRALAEAAWPADRKICAIITRETDESGIANVATLRDEFGPDLPVLDGGACETSSVPPSPTSSTSSIRSSRGSWWARAAPWHSGDAGSTGCWCESGGWIRRGCWSPTWMPTTEFTRSTSTT